MADAYNRKDGLVRIRGRHIYEAVFLSLQAARGVRSHFNDATAFDAIGASILAAGAGVAAVLREKVLKERA